MNMTLRYLLRGLVFFTLLMLASCRITGVSEKSENQKDDNYISPPPAPRYRKDTFYDKYFNTDNLPNKYHVNHNIQ